MRQFELPCLDSRKSFYGKAHCIEHENGVKQLLSYNTTDNLKNTLDRIGGLLSANIFATRKQADETVTRWNAVYKANKEYLFEV